jgi:hypothetical protein
MKKILTLIIVGAFVAALAIMLTNRAMAIQAQSPDAVVGLWGGKWDDTWPVFLLIERNAEPNTYKVQYRWLENSNDPTFSTQELIGYQTNQYVHAKHLDFRMTETYGMLYGAFKNPRMANLVRLDPSEHPSVENDDALLRKYGWTEGRIPARKALKIITGP